MRPPPHQGAAASVLVLLLVALPLAGCVAPAQEPPASPVPTEARGAPDLPPSPTSIMLAEAEHEDNRTRTCTLGPERNEDRRRGGLVLRVEGCTELVGPLLLGDRGEALRVDFSVPPGTRHLMVQVHFHGPERLVAVLDDVDHGRSWEREDWNGTENRDSVARWEHPSPAAGDWRVRGYLDGLVAARTWTVVVVAEPQA